MHSFISQNDGSVYNQLWMKRCWRTEMEWRNGAASVVGDVFERDVESDTGHRKWWWQVRRGSLSPHHDSGAAATSTLPTCLPPKSEENHGDISQTCARTHAHGTDGVNMTSFCCFKCTYARDIALKKCWIYCSWIEQNAGFLRCVF